MSDAAGERGSQTRRATIRDVSRLAGVSVGTVSHVMNGTATVSLDKAERVREAIQTLNYRPSHAAAALVHRRTATIAFSYVASRLEGDLFKCQIMISLATALARRRLTLLLAPEDDAQGPDGSAARRFALERRLDGVVLTDLDLEDGRLTELTQLGVACVVYGAARTNLVDTVDVDERQGIDMAVDHLIALGHTAIAFLAAPTREDYALSRLDAYDARMAAAGLTPTVIMASGYRVADGRRVVAAFKGLDSVTGLVCATDQLALGAMQAAVGRGRRVPADLSMVGFDDIPMAELASPGLTTVRQPIERIARTLVACLIPALPGAQTADSKAPRPHLVAPRLVIRGTTAPPSAPTAVRPE